jgi:transposase-like protein
MNAYSKDLRIKALGALERGMPRKEAANTFGVSLATLKRWLKRRREGGGHSTEALAGAHPTHPRYPRAATRPVGAARRERRGHACAPLRALGEPDGGCGLGGDDEPGRAQAGLDLQKKSVVATERDERARGSFRERLRGIDPELLRFVEESSTNG